MYQVAQTAASPCRGRRLSRQQMGARAALAGLLLLAAAEAPAQVTDVAFDASAKHADGATEEGRRKVPHLQEEPVDAG